MDTIKCRSCGAEIELTEALTSEIESQLLIEERARHQRELGDIRRDEKAAADARARKEFEQRSAELQAEAREEKERSAKLLADLGKLTDDMRQLRRRDEERELAYKQQLADAEEKIRADARKSVEENYALQLRQKDQQLGDALDKIKERERQLAAEREQIRSEARRIAEDDYGLKLREKDKQLADAWQKVKEAEAKINQGSQQTQGEVLELELEEILRDAYRDDEIQEVKKGHNGADIVHKIVDQQRRACGTILWETKNGKWQAGWLAKLRDDQREAKAHIAVLVAVNPPAGIDTFAQRDGVWIVKRRYARDLAPLLRQILIAVHAERANQAGKDEKMEILYGYLISTEFQHRVQAIVEGFNYLWNDIEREKRWFETKWARQEKEIRKIIDSTQGMYGDLQAVTGRALAPIAALELPEAADPELENPAAIKEAA